MQGGCRVWNCGEGVSVLLSELLPKEVLVSRNKKDVSTNIMHSKLQKVGREWQRQTKDGGWRTEYVEPDIAILQPEIDGEGFVWNELELKKTGKKGMGVFAKRDLPKGTEFPILGDTGGDCSRTHSWEHYDRSRPEDHKPMCIDGHPGNDPHKGVANYGLSIAMMLNEANNPNCIFRQSNYIQLVRDVKKGQELTVFYGDGREMKKIRKEQGYAISYTKTKDWPKESGTPAQRVVNFKFFMGLIVQRKLEKEIEIKSKSKYVSDNIKEKMSRPRRTGARNTYHCKFLGTKLCKTKAGLAPTLYINPDLGVMSLHCLECMKREASIKGIKSVAPGEWKKILESSSSSSLRTQASA